jgi:ATP-dependent DNA ligase
LCGVRLDGITSFSMIQMASDAGNAAGLVFFLFDLLDLDGEGLAARPLIERKERLGALLPETGSVLHYSDHQTGLGRPLREGLRLAVEGIVSKRADTAYIPGNRGLWLKVKCLNREEFVVIGWTDPEGARPFSARCLSATTIPTEGSPMPAASAPASTRNSRGFGAGWTSGGRGAPPVPYPKADNAAVDTEK